MVTLDRIIRVLPYAIVPHYRSPGHPETQRAIRAAAQYAAVGVPHRTCRDGLRDSRTRPQVLTRPSRSSLVFVDNGAEDRPTLDPLLVEVGDGGGRAGAAALAAAVGSLFVVVPEAVLR